MNGLIRQSAFGQGLALTWVDRFGIWLSARQIRRWIPSFSSLSVGDFGSGYQAAFARTFLEEARSVTLVDVALANDLKAHPRVRAIESFLPGALPLIDSESLDVVLAISVLEHLWEPDEALKEFYRILRPGGICLLNVPSWRGKRALEFSAFRLKMSPEAEMNDHKMYFDARDLWPILVRAGFLPSRIRCFSHKLGLNTFAVCRKQEH